MFAEAVLSPISLFVDDQMADFGEIILNETDLGAVYSGLQADGRTLIDYARVQSQVQSSIYRKNEISKTQESDAILSQCDFADVFRCNNT